MASPRKKFKVPKKAARGIVISNVQKKAARRIENLNVQKKAAHRVFATPGILENIMFYLQMIEMFSFQRVNRAFNNIFHNDPSLLRTNGVRRSLRPAIPSDFVENFAPFVDGLEAKKLLIRPFEFDRVGTEQWTGMRMLKFTLNTDMAEHAKNCGTIMGYAGLSGKDYAADSSWGDIAIATTTFCVSIGVSVCDQPLECGCQVMNRFYYQTREQFGPSVTILRDLFQSLEAVRDRSTLEHERGLEAEKDRARITAYEALLQKSPIVLVQWFVREFAFIMHERSNGQQDFRQGAYFLHSKVSFHSADANYLSKVIKPTLTSSFFSS